MNSEAMSAETHKVIANTAPHAGEREEIEFASETARTFIKGASKLL
jgi:hypothetical protein